MLRLRDFAAVSSSGMPAESGAAYILNTAQGSEAGRVRPRDNIRFRRFRRSVPLLAWLCALDPVCLSSSEKEYELPN